MQDTFYSVSNYIFSQSTDRASSPFENSVAGVQQSFEEYGDYITYYDFGCVKYDIDADTVSLSLNARRKKIVFQLFCVVVQYSAMNTAQNHEIVLRMGKIAFRPFRLLPQLLSRHS